MMLRSPALSQQKKKKKAHSVFISERLILKELCKNLNLFFFIHLLLWKFLDVLTLVLGSGGLVIEGQEHKLLGVVGGKEFILG